MENKQLGLWGQSEHREKEHIYGASLEVKVEKCWDYVWSYMCASAAS